MRNPSQAILRRLSGFCGKLKRAAELGWRDSDNPPEHLREMAWAGVANVEAHIDKAARGFTNQLLGARDSLSRDELQRSHAGRLLEHMGKVRGTQFHQFSESVD